MIDFVKMDNRDCKSIEKIWTNPLLYFDKDVSRANKKTGEIEQTKTKQFEGILFNLLPHTPKNANEGTERLEIRFKPHYWHNNDIHNANDFTPHQAIATIQRFISVFNIDDPENFKAVNLEYGLNFLIDGYGKDLTLYPAFHSRNPFYRDKDNRFSSISHSFDMNGKPNKYLQIKFYSKGFQYPEHCPGNTLRYEIKTKQSKKINQLNINNIADLLKIEVYQLMKNELIKQAGKMLIIDPNPTLKNLNKKTSNKLNQYSNQYYWNKTVNQQRSQSFNEKKEIYFKHLDKTGHNINQLFLDSLVKKLNYLFEINGKNSTPVKKEINGKNSTMLKVEYIPFMLSRALELISLSKQHQKTEGFRKP